MVTPASPESNSERYTAGDCVLEVHSQPSALSQWSSRPIVQQLTFQLWLGPDGEEANGEKRSLLAEGDRVALQSITQYFQHQTQQVLAIASLNRPSLAAPTASSQQPQNLQITTPLSYLQLADVTAVLSQYEQSARLLPVELSAAAPERSPAAQPSTTNVVSLDEARRRAGRQPARRKRNSMWISSAAAALFAVGLTSTLWLRDSSLQQLNTASEPAAPATQAGPLQSEPSQANDDNAKAGSAETLQSQAVPSAGAPAPNSTNARPGAASTTRQPTPSANRETSLSQEPIAEDAPAGRQPDTNFSTGNRPDATNQPLATVDESPPATSAPEAASPPAPVPEAAIEELPEAPPESAAETARASEANAPPAEPSRIAESEPENVFTPPQSSGSPTAQTGQVSRRRSPNRRQGQSTAERESPEITSEAEDADMAADVSEADISPVVEQVRSYFQQRWPADETSSLTYRLELSNTGDVLRFEGIDEASRRERDRILPSDPSPNFAVDTLTQPITLRVFLLPDGDVQVLEL